LRTPRVVEPDTVLPSRRTTTRRRREKSQAGTEMVCSRRNGKSARAATTIVPAPAHVSCLKNISDARASYVALYTDTSPMSVSNSEEMPICRSKCRWI
jgi:hypothetical protein